MRTSGDSGKQAVPGIRRADFTRLLARIERQCIGVDRLAPEGLFEVCLQSGCAITPPLGLTAVAARGR